MPRHNDASCSPNAARGPVGIVGAPEDASSVHLPGGDEFASASSGTARNREYAHGDQCSCLLLALAVRAGRDAVSFSYCRSVLQKHWQVHCNHGVCHAEREPVSPAERWINTGHPDSVKAILIRES